MQTTEQTTPITVVIEKDDADWSDPVILGPIVGALIVAVVGAWVTHKLAKRRARAKGKK